MEARPWIRETEEKDLAPDFEIWGKDKWESSNVKRKIESSYGLFCFMRKKIPRHKSFDEIFPDLEDNGEMDECWSSDIELSECSEFDIISQHVLDDLDLTGESIGSKSLAICNFPWPTENEGTPAGESRILLENCSLHQNVRCINENNVHGDDIGIEITPIPLTKTLEGPSRSLSVCGSLAAGRNIPPVEENLSSSENRDAELAQTTSTLYQEEVDDEDEMCFSDIDAMIHRLNLLPEDSDTCLNMSKHPRHTLLGLEHCTRTSARRALMFQGAIAILHCRESKHFIRKHKVIIGRSSRGLNVDIDLGKDGYGSKISRRQALVKLEDNGSFSLKNLGKRYILVNGRKLNTGQIGTLVSCSSINFEGTVFEFKINKEAVRQFLKNNTRSNSADDAKFRWCE